MLYEQRSGDFFQRPLHFEGKAMNKLHRFEIWAALLLMVWLAALSVVTAFYGAQRTAMFFNSLPLVIYWLTLTGLLLAGLITFRRLIRLPGLLLIHLGCVFILVGAMFGSARGHHLRKKLFGIEKVPFGYMMIYEGTAENTIVAEDGTVLAELPFSIYLKDFRIEYYSHPPALLRKQKGGADIRDYFSDVILLEGEKQIAQKVLEVNHPLHYGGYHFYQHSYDMEKGEYTILTVVSDSGLNLVYTGYVVLSVAVLWHFWLRHIGAYVKKVCKWRLSTLSRGY